MLPVEGMPPPSLVPLHPPCSRLWCSLSACAVAGILVGDIDKWNAPLLKELNPEARGGARLAVWAQLPV